MCVIIVLNQLREDLPVVIAANRDEFLSRASTPAGPHWPGILAGRDELGGGTWLGVNGRGLFVGVTNQRTTERPRASPISRGLVVLDALRCERRADIARQLQRLDPSQVGGFNLLFGDASGLSVASARPDRQEIELQDVPQGIHVLPNDSLNSARFAKVARARELLGSADELKQMPWESLLERLRRALSDHEMPDQSALPPSPVIPSDWQRKLEALCVHTALYGTRSASILALEKGACRHFLHTDKAPCVSDFKPLDLAALREGPAT